MSDQADFERFQRRNAPRIRLAHARALAAFPFAMHRPNHPVALARALTIRFGVFSPDGHTQWLMYPRKRGWTLRFRRLGQLLFAQNLVNP